MIGERVAKAFEGLTSRLGHVIPNCRLEKGIEESEHYNVQRTQASRSGHILRYLGINYIGPFHGLRHAT